MLMNTETKQNNIIIWLYEVKLCFKKNELYVWRGK